MASPISKSGPSESPQYSPEEIAQMEQEAKERYLAECLKNFKFDPTSDLQQQTVKIEPMGNDYTGIKDLKLLLSMIHKRFTGKAEDLRVFLDQTHNAYELCHYSLRQSLLAIIFNEIEGEPREKLRERPEIDSYQKLRKFLKEHYEPRESFAQAYSKLAAATQAVNETVRQFGDRLTNLAYLAKIASQKEHKIVKEVSTVDGKTEVVEKTIGLSPEAATQMIEFMALERFKVGSKTEISRFIRCHPYATTLNTAIHEAIEFETKETQETALRQQTNNFTNTRRGKWCKNHNIATHWTSECRLNSNKDTSKYCTYCKIAGHSKDYCRRRQQDELKKNPPANPSVATISCKYCKAEDHEIRNCKILAKKKRDHPEKYDRTHPDYKGPAQRTNSNEQSNSETIDKPDARRIAIISSKPRPIAEFNSPSVNTGQLHILIDSGADISLIKESCLTEATRQKIDRKNAESLSGLSDNRTLSLGKVPIRIHIENRIYEIDFHVVANSDLQTSFDGSLAAISLIKLIHQSTTNHTTSILGTGMKIFHFTENTNCLHALAPC